MYKLSLTTFLLFSLNMTYAQDIFISGTVTNEATAEPLYGATIVVDNKDGITTNFDGKYKIKILPGTHTIKASYIGFENKKLTINVAKSKQLDFALTEKSEQLNLIVISASQHEKNVAEETVSVDVLDKDLVKNTNSRDVGEAIYKTPGVQIQDGQISIRSGSSYSYGVGSRTALLVDNLGLMSADLGDAQIKLAQVENVDQIEVIKGASSVVYGSSALDGVVNIRTGWPKTGEKSTELNMYYGVYGKPPREELKWWGGRQPGFSGMFFNHKQRFKNLQFVAGGNIDNVQSYLEKADEFRLRWNFKTNYILPKNKKISFGVNANQMWETSGRFFISQDLDSNAYRIQEGSVDRYLRTNVDPHFTYQNENGHRYEINARYLNIWRKGNGTDPNASSNSYYIENQYQFNWIRKLILTTGLPIDFGVSRSNLYDGTRITFSGAFYTQLEYKIKKLSLVGGVRYEISQVDTIFETSIPVFRSGLNYQIGKTTFLRTSWGQAYRLPSVGERFIAADIFNGFYIVPNPDLLAEKGWSYELGVKQGIKVKKWLGYFDYSLFWNEYDNYVEYVPGLYPNFDANGDTLFSGRGLFVFGLNPKNIENARVFGMEATLAGEGNFGPVKVTTLLGYTYTYPGNLEADSTETVGVFLKRAFKNFAKRIDQESLDAQGLLFFRSRHVVRGDIEIEYKKFSIGYSLYYNSFPEKIPPLFVTATSLLDGGKGTLEKYIEKHKSGDLVMDARVSYEISDLFRLSILVKNLTNHEYSQRPGKLEPPISFTLQLRFTF